jgi:hypothetical protein
VLPPEISRRRLTRTLNAAYADGLISHDTFIERIEWVLTGRVLYPRRLIGDLNFRRTPGTRTRIRTVASTLVNRLLTLIDGGEEEHPALLALDWTGKQEELVIGRQLTSDIVLSDPSVSRRHARLVFRAGGWVIQDLESTNGTVLNGRHIGRAELRPGDVLVLGCEHLRVD